MAEFEPEWDADQLAALAGIRRWFAQCEERDGIPYGCRESACTGTREGYWHTHRGARGAGEAPVASLGGLAGSGKTTLVRALEGALGVRAVYGTPTHKAASVLRRKMAGDPEQAGRVRTYHSMVYFASELHRCRTSKAYLRQVKSACGHGVPYTAGCAHGCAASGGTGMACADCAVEFARCGSHGGTECVMDSEPSFAQRPYLAGVRRLVIIDEASMLSEEQVGDIRRFGVPVLLCGDHGQLPPVKAEMNRWMSDPDFRLEGNHRTADGSEGISDTARAVRLGRRLAPGTSAPGLWTVRRDDPGLASIMTPDGFRAGPERCVIAWRNSTRSMLNKVFHGDGPVRAGDRVIALRTGTCVPVEPDGAGGFAPGTLSTLELHNGVVGTVEAARVEVSDRRAHLVVRLDDPVTVWFEEPESDGDGPQQQQEGAAVRRKVTVDRVRTVAALGQFGRAEALPLNGREAKPSGAMLWDYAYVVTAHKAQGSEFEDVIIVDERPMDYERWMYTALTRAKKRAVVIRW